MSDHPHFEELAALEAGGFLSDEELIELREHTAACVECRETEEEFNQTRSRRTAFDHKSHSRIRGQTKDPAR